MISRELGARGIAGALRAALPRGIPGWSCDVSRTSPLLEGDVSTLRAELHVSRGCQAACLSCPVSRTWALWSVAPGVGGGLRTFDEGFFVGHTHARSPAGTHGG